MPTIILQKWRIKYEQNDSTLPVQEEEEEGEEGEEEACTGLEGCMRKKRRQGRSSPP